ncbi:high-temperature-induced dauer-formation protein-domain-containing protein [Syncephalastrum racemosum]|uniref:High-temperature-induced dauer-formation protein-domain-containing protein n=1 Tax=Syncephalastrum racemosum TaxID=13706 RepID=A0A1X2HVR3_SYNRA|nr:high-temperature-induced dauer-formation protein-domain-containing protein [Syncephalastrum racemosum]
MGATDSKLAFRKGVFRLFEERNIPFAADDYWTLFWTLPESVDDVYSLIGASDIRRARDSSRENLETLIDKVLGHMVSIVEAPNFPAAPNTISELLNCFRVLSRVIPYIFEYGDSSEWEDKLFWVPRSVERLPTPAAAADHEQDGQKAQPQYDTLPPRGDIIMSLTLKCLFLAGFTLPSTMTSADGNKVNHVIWESGVGSSTPIASSREHDLNRIEVLRLLIVLLSKSMYVPPSQVLSKEDRWLHYVVAKTERKVVLALLCSLLNTACKYNPLGWGVPYNHVVFTDTREQLVVMCLRVLLVILDYHSPRVAQTMRQLDQRDTAPPAEMVNGVELMSIQDPEKRKLAEREQPPVDNTAVQAIDHELDETHENAFRHYLSKLHRAQDFQFLIDGIYRILSNPMQATNTYLPGSTKRVRCHVEMMMLCWKLLETNSRFRNYLMETERALDLMVVLVFYAIENKTNPAQVGLVRMCAFILQTLSSDRTFGVKLNRHFDGHSSLPASIRITAFHGTYADFLITSVFSLIATSRGALSTLYPALILTVTNISPYLKNLSVTSSNKLVSLFGSLSAPGFLLADEANHRLVGYMLEAFNNMVQYQFSDNANLVYAIVRSHSKFEKLRDFTLEGALADMDRLRQAKEDKLRRNSQQQQQQQQHQAPPTPTSESSSPPAMDTNEAPNADNDGKDENKDGLSEKARGKLPESNASSSSSPQTKLHPMSPQRQASASSIASAVSLLPGAKHGFLPTEEWVQSWQKHLPLEPLLVLLEHLTPQVEALCSTQTLTSDGQVLEFLRNNTLVGILPPPQAIFIRKFRWGEALVIWFRSMLWGQAYVSSITEYCPWNGTQVKLFQIKQQLADSPQQPTQPSTPTTAAPAPPASSHPPTPY